MIRICRCGHKVADHRTYFDDAKGLATCSVPDCGCEAFVLMEKKVAA